MAATTPDSESDGEDPNQITDVVSCLNYLKRREVFLYKMMADPSHKAMLYFLEVLMNSEGPISVAELATRCTGKQFSSDMRAAVGGSEDSLRSFLMKYPSLFRVDGNSVSSVSLGEIPSCGSVSNGLCGPSTSGGTSGESSTTRRDSTSSTQSGEGSVLTRGGYGRSSGGAGSGSTSNLGSATTSTPAWDFGVETEAVKFFQTRLSKREERWIPVKSLAGHLSQASSEIRACVGPQLDFRKFLAKHPHVFEIQGELVGLRDPFPSTCLAGNKRQRPTLTHSNSARAARPKSLVMGSGNSNSDILMRSERAGSGRGMSGGTRVCVSSMDPGTVAGHTSAPTTPIHTSTSSTCLHHHTHHHNGVSTSSAPVSATHSVNLSNSCGGVSSAVAAAAASVVSCNGSKTAAPVSMSANEYKAIMYLRKVLERSKGGAVEYPPLFAHLSNAPEAVRNTVGWTQIELEEFITKNSLFFEINSGVVSPRRATKLNIIITGSRVADSGTRTLTNKKGRVYHVAKLWGIIDLGRHEHVFFDKSIFKHVDDLQRHFKIGETLYFNAILAPKESRAKWRATQVWKESDRAVVERLAGGALSRRSGCDGAETTDAGGSNTGSVSDCSGLGYSPGLELADDIRFFSDDIDENELRRVLEGNGGDEVDSDEDGLSIPSPDMPGSPLFGESNLNNHVISFAHTHNSLNNNNNNNNNTYTNLCNNNVNNNNNHINSSRPTSASTHNGCSPIREEPSGGALKQKKSSATIATQTLSTGDIMATQIFHEGMSRLV